MPAVMPPDEPESRPDAILRSTPQTVVWGLIAAGVPPVLHIRPGQIVRIDTVSHQGINTDRDPVAYFAAAGIPSDDVLPDATAIHRTVKRAEGAGPHVITGPVYIEGAQPGDMLEVRILDIAVRVPYGVNSTGPGSGVLPNLIEQSAPRIIKLDLARNVALFSRDIEVPLSPFMGIMAVAPAPERSPASTKPPDAFGGNMDFKHLKAGATLYLPVFNEGALFYTGDGHAVQGDGEVDGTAIEISLSPTLQFLLHKGAGAQMIWPRAEDTTHYYSMGMDADLDTAMRYAVQETVIFLGREAGLSAAEAYALASLAVDFRVGEAVNKVQMVYGMIPKKLFRPTPEYWRKE